MDNIIPIELYLCEIFNYLNYDDIISFIMTCKYYNYTINDSWDIIFKNKYMGYVKLNNIFYYIFIFKNSYYILCDKTITIIIMYIFFR